MNDYDINRQLQQEDAAEREAHFRREDARRLREAQRLSNMRERAAWRGGPGISLFVTIAFVVGFGAGALYERTWPAPDVMPSLAEEVGR